MRYSIIRLRSIITMAVLNLLKFLTNDYSQSVSSKLICFWSVCQNSITQQICITKKMVQKTLKNEKKKIKKKKTEKKKRYFHFEPKATLTEVQDLTTSARNHLHKVGAFTSTYSAFTSTYTTQVKYLYYRLAIDRYRYS